MIVQLLGEVPGDKRSFTGNSILSFHWTSIPYVLCMSPVNKPSVPWCWKKDLASGTQHPCRT